MWTDVIGVFQKYMGTGLIVIWFLGALVYLFLNEKRRERRLLFVWLPVIVLLLYFNPLFAGVFCSMLGSEIYFRNCWMIPFIPVIAYATVCILERLKGVKQLLFGTAAVLLIVVSGKLVYANPLYSRAENCYHVPDSVVHLCDAIVVPGREVMAVFPSELLLYVRQYSPFVCMPYGRNSFFSDQINDFYIAMEQDVMDVAALSVYAYTTGCHYIVLREDKEMLGEPKDYGWEFFGQTDGYVVYRNVKMPLDF